MRICNDVLNEECEYAMDSGPTQQELWSIKVGMWSMNEKSIFVGKGTLDKNSQDYHDHNQDDSDSSEHNKSVQVESEKEEEEPVRRTGKKAIGKKAPAKRWSDEEEVALARSWLTISENPDVGNAQKKDGFYRKIFLTLFKLTKKVTEHFYHLMKDKSRTVDQIYSKWNDMNSSMKKWNDFYQQASMNRKRGEGMNMF
ncbi:hypothetical protein R6Q57_016836 [Mikania cordata]